MNWINPPLIELSKRGLCLLLMFLHLFWLYPNNTLGADEFRFGEKHSFLHPLSQQLGDVSSRLNLSLTNRGYTGSALKGDGIPDGIPEETETLWMMNVPGPQTAELNIPLEAEQLLARLNPVEQEAARDLIADTAQASWQEYLGWFNGEAPARLHLELIQSTGREMNLDGKVSRLVVAGYDANDELMGELSFRLAPPLIEQGGNDFTSRDYENFQESEQVKGQSIAHWMRRLDVSFNVLDWVRIDVDDEGNIIHIIPGPAALALKEEAVGGIMSAIARLEGRGSQTSTLGLLQVFSNIPLDEEVGCALAGIGSAAMFGLAAKLVVWVATRIVIGIIGAVFILPLIALFGEIFTAIQGMRMAIDAIQDILDDYLHEFVKDRQFRELLRRSMRVPGMTADSHLRLQQWEGASYQALAKLKLRYLKKIFFVQNLGRIIGWAAAVLSAAIGGYQVWKECKARKWFPARARALAGVELFIYRNPDWIRVSNVLAADGQDNVLVLQLSREELESFIVRDYSLRRAYVGFGARLRLDMGRHPDTYANTIESPRDPVSPAGRYRFGYGGPEGWGYGTWQEGVSILLNEPTMTVKVSDDRNPGYWRGWPAIDPYNPSGHDSCDVTEEPGRPFGECRLSIATEHDWESPPDNPSPNVVFVIRFPRVRI